MLITILFSLFFDTLIFICGDDISSNASIAFSTKLINACSINDLSAKIFSSSDSILVIKSIDLITNIESDELNILADKSLIEQALINLVLNAIDALEEISSPQIKINVSKNKENRIVISIEDNGKGISENDLENIFIPFYTTKKQGSGIGLSLTKQVMFLHKGNITVQSELGKGTKFVISF